MGVFWQETGDITSENTEEEKTKDGQWFAAHHSAEKLLSCSAATSFQEVFCHYKLKKYPQEDRIPALKSLLSILWHNSE